MKKLKIIIAIIFITSLAWNTNHKVCAQEALDVKSVSELLKIITHQHDNYSLVKKAAALLEKQTPTTEKEIVQLFELVGETKGDVQQKFINALSNTTDVAFAPVFIRELESEHPMRVAAACGMSGKLKLRAAVPGLIGVIERYGVIEGGADTGAERAVATATLALGEIGDKRGLEVLAKYMGKLDRYDSAALAKFGAQALVTLLKKIKEDHKSPAARSAVAAISKITDPEAAFHLNRIIEHKAHPARKSAVIAMFNIAPEATVRHLLEMWRKDKDPFLERRLLLHINQVRLKDPALCPFLIHALKESSSMYARKGAALALGRIGGAEAVKALQRAAVYDNDYFVRVYAQQALKMAHDSLDQIDPGAVKQENSRD
jgi:HEAT repeat protein